MQKIHVGDIVQVTLDEITRREFSYQAQGTSYRVGLEGRYGPVSGVYPDQHGGTFITVLLGTCEYTDFEIYELTRIL